MRCELITWPEIYRLCLDISKQVHSSGYQPDIVIAIARGGFIPARLVCDFLDLNALTSIKIQHYRSGADRLEKAVLEYPLCTEIRDLNVLLVDDVNDSGKTLKLAVSYLQTFQPADIKTIVMHQKMTSRYPIDFYAKKVIKWRWLIYPWAVFEDVSGFLRRKETPPASIEEAQAYLSEFFNINLSRKRLETIMSFMDQS
jgi:hypoxanthine phosphoribosyltransferase